jgi:hypothetical protein
VRFEDQGALFIADSVASKGLHVLARLPALEHIDSGPVEQVPGHREIQTPRCLTGLFNDPNTGAEVDLPLAGVDPEMSSHDDHEIPPRKSYTAWSHG